MTKTTANELEVAQFYAWGAPLAQNITSVIGENLSVLIPTDRIVPMPANLTSRSTMRLRSKSSSSGATLPEMSSLSRAGW